MNKSVKPQPLDKLDSNKIKSGLVNPSIQVSILEEVDSTNNYLKDFIGQTQEITACIAEMQTQGKGRLNRQWHSPFGQNIYLSLLYPAQKVNRELSGLSLVVALATCQAIESICKLDKPLVVKWPNDITSEQQKIAGNLIEVQTDSNKKNALIIGVGINVNMQQADSKQIDQQWSSLQKLTGAHHDRNTLCSTVINSINDYLQRLNINGLKDFMQEWNNRDCLLNKTLHLSANKNKIIGVGAGINTLGQLLIKLPDGTEQAFSSGDTTLAK